MHCLLGQYCTVKTNIHRGEERLCAVIGHDCAEVFFLYTAIATLLFIEWAMIMMTSSWQVDSHGTVFAII